MTLEPRRGRTFKLKNVETVPVCRRRRQALRAPEGERYTPVGRGRDAEPELPSPAPTASGGAPVGGTRRDGGRRCLVTSRGRHGRQDGVIGGHFLQFY